MGFYKRNGLASNDNSVNINVDAIQSGATNANKTTFSKETLEKAIKQLPPMKDNDLTSITNYFDSIGDRLGKETWDSIGNASYEPLDARLNALTWRGDTIKSSGLTGYNTDLVTSAISDNPSITDKLSERIKEAQEEMKKYVDDAIRRPIIADTMGNVDPHDYIRRPDEYVSIKELNGVEVVDQYGKVIGKLDQILKVLTEYQDGTQRIETKVTLRIERPRVQVIMGDKEKS